jgi:tetratricopeptide (TPR) repeat protein
MIINSLQMRRAFALLLLLCVSSSIWAGAEESFVRKRFVEARDLAARSASLDDLGILGWSQFMLDDYGSAMNSFRKLERSWPNDFDALLGLAWVHTKTGNLAEAEKYLKKAEAVTVAWQRPLVHDLKGWQAMKRGNYIAAARHFEDEEMDPGGAVRSDAAVGLGWLAFNRGDLARARQEFERGLARDSKCFFCRDGLARIALARGELKVALGQVLGGMEVTSDSPGLNSLLSSVLAAMNDPASSRRIYETLIARHPNVIAYRIGLGNALLAEGRAEEAEAEFRKVLATDAGNSEAQAGIAALQILRTRIVKEGWEAYFRGLYDKALSLFDGKRKQAAAIRNPSAEDGRGWTLLALGRNGEARDAFRAAIAMDPQFFYSVSGLATAEGRLLGNYRKAWILLDAGRFDEAVSMFGKARSQTPADLQWLIQDGLAWVSFFRKEYAAAEKGFAAVLASNKDAYLSEMGLGRVALERKDYSAAIRHVSRSLLLNPYQLLVSYTIPAAKLIDAGQFRDARDILMRGERIYPSSADIHYLLARAQSGLNEEQGAGTSLAKAAELAPFHIDPVFDKVPLGLQAKQTALLSIGWALYYAGGAAAAAKRFEQYVAAGGTAVGGLLGSGWSQLALKNQPGARKSFEAAIRGGDTGDAHAGLGWIQMGSEQFADAERSFKTALRALPNHASAQSGLAAIQFRKTVLVKDGWDAYYKEDYKKALNAFEAKLNAAAAARNPAAEDGRGWTLLAMGNTRAARDAFDKALRIDADYYSSQSGRIAARRAELVLYQQAWGHLEAGQFDQARTKFENARKESAPEFIWLIDDGLAWLALYTKDYDGAEKAFQAIVAKMPRAYLSHKGLGYLAIERKQYSAAARALVTAYSLAPYQGVTSYTVPGLKLIDGKAYPQAQEVLSVGEKVYPYSSDIQFLLARTALGLGDEDTAAHKAATAATLAPAYIDPAFDRLGLPPRAARTALPSLAWGLYFAGDNAGAIKRFDAALRVGATDPNIARGKGFALFRQGRYRDALPLLEAAMKLEPEKLLPIVDTVPIPGTNQSWTIEYTAGTTLAWAHHRLGAHARADQLFTAAVTDNPVNIDALTGLGYVRLALKDAAGAQIYFDRALRISPLYPDALKGLAAVRKP